MSGIRTETGVDEELMRRMSELLIDQVRVSIVSQCGVGPTSPRAFREAFGGPSLARLHEAFIALERVGWLERVPGPGGPPDEEFDRPYRRKATTVVGREDFASFPESVRSLFSMRIIESLSVRTKDAMKAGTIAARDDSHLTWTPLALDQEGWEALIRRIDELFYSLPDAQKEAEARMAESGEEPLEATVGLLAFESPRH